MKDGLKDFNAFTAKAKGISNVVKTPIAISHPIDPSEKIHHGPQPEYTAIWDTGATGSVIVKSLASKLGLKPVGRKQINTAGGLVEKNEYLVSIFLPNMVVISPVAVTECDELSGDSLVLIGMDVISKGDFSITNSNGYTQMSFRTPSIAHIDYVEEAESVKRQRRRLTFKMGKEAQIKKKRAKNKQAAKSRKKNRR